MIGISNGPVVVANHIIIVLVTGQLIVGQGLMGQLTGQVQVTTSQPTVGLVD